MNWLVSHSYNSYDQWPVVSLLFLAHVIGHSCWLPYKMEHGWLWFTYNLSQRGSLICNCEVGVQSITTLHVTVRCANNSINSDERNRPHSYPVQQKSRFIPVGMRTCPTGAENPISFHQVPLHDIMMGAWCAMSATKIIGSIFNFMWPYIHTNVIHIVTFFITCLMREPKSFFTTGLSTGMEGLPSIFVTKWQEIQPLKLLGLILHML